MIKENWFIIWVAYSHPLRFWASYIFYNYTYLECSTMIFQVHHCDWFWRSGQSIINIYTDHRQWMSHSTLQLQTKNRKNIINMKISVVFVTATIAAIWLGKSIHCYSLFISLPSIPICRNESLSFWCKLIKEQSAKK